MAIEPNPTQEARQATEGECGGCDICVFIAYDEDDPETHCIDCTCFLCIPGG